MPEIEVSGICITYNSAETLERTLNNMRKGVDELIVVDTGSTDDTLDIAEEYGAIVYIIPIRLHFGDLRNEAIRRARGKWIFMLDDDEIIEEQFYQDLRNMIRGEYDAYKIPRKTYIDGVFDEKAYPDYQVRLFRRYCRWIYPVHEELVGFKNCGICRYNIIHSKSSRKNQNSNGYWRLLERIMDRDLPTKK